MIKTRKQYLKEFKLDAISLMLEQGFTELPITVNHAQRAAALPGLHKDPFDRTLIAQAHAENLPLISNEKLFDQYAVQRVW